jgi:hypothetical protein
MTAASTHTRCECCAEKDERIAWLESELGIQREGDGIQNLRVYMLAQPVPRAYKVKSVNFVMALFQAKGRLLTRDQVLIAIPPANGGEDERWPKIVDVWACHARRCLGREMIENVWGKGYRLSPAGMALVGAIVRGEHLQVAA